MACKQTGLDEIQEKMYRVKTLRAGNHMVDRLRVFSNYSDDDSAIVERAKYTREREISRGRDPRGVSSNFRRSLVATSFLAGGNFRARTRVFRRHCQN